MKTINTYINEKLHLTAKRQYTCQPKSKKELQDIILQRIKDDGNECDLNDIDVSKITDMSDLFTTYDNKIFKNFNGDISQWDVSNVKNMYAMFFECANFNKDISQWNVSNVEDMNGMFLRCSKFNCDISGWDVSNAKYMTEMFYECKNFNCDISRWNVSNVKGMMSMFKGCKKFNQNLDTWDVSNVEIMEDAFDGCPTKPKWYVQIITFSPF